METVLSIKNLTKKYGLKYAIKNISFEVEKGKVYGLLGPNGSGKTTTLGIVLGIINKSKGSYEWFNETPSHTHLKRIGALLENPNFYPYMSGLENLKLVADIKEVDHSSIGEKLKLVNLFDRRYDKYQTYSLGMKQRLAIASALLNEPEVLVLDEPTNGLDPQGISEIRELITEVAKKGTTIVLASHLLDEVEKVCTDVIVLKNGEIIYTGEIGKDSGYGTLIAKYEDTERLKHALETLPEIGEISVEKDFIKADLNKEVAAEQINKFLAEKNIFVSHLTIEKQNLESKFLEITKTEK